MSKAKATTRPRAKTARKAAAPKTVKPPRIVRQLARVQTRLERMAARATVLKDRAAARKNDKAASAHEKAHGVLIDAKQRIDQIAKGVGA